MHTLDQPPLPEVPRFSHDMQAFLRTTARSRPAHRRRAGRPYLAVAAAAAAVIAAVVFGIVHILGPGGPARGHPSGPVQLASFSVTTAPNGLVMLRLTPGQLRDPNSLRQALAHAGVPALVTAHSVCYLPGPNAQLLQVLPGRPHRVKGGTVWTINPAAIPAGQELSIGYYQVSSGFGIHISLVPEHRTLTCGATPPVPPHG
jgi:hypothetical protein